MRMHLGFSFSIKKILKWIIPIIVGLAAYFGIFQTQVLAAVVAGPGYYSIPSTDTQCNIFMGDTVLSQNIFNTQVRYNINYDDTTLTLLQVQNGSNQGWKSSNLSVRYQRNATQTLQLSFKVTNNDLINACTQWPSTIPSADRTAANCMNPVVYVYYCQDSTFDINNSSSCYYESFNNNSTRSVLNHTLRSNSWINNYKHTSSDTTWDYIQILLPNMTNASSGVPSLGTGWEYYDFYLGDYSFDETSTMLHNYCSSTGAPSGGSNINNGDIEGITEGATQAIIDTLTGPDGVLMDPTIPNINLPFFSDLLFNPTNIQGLLTFPINLLYVITSNQDTCTPYSFNLSSLTRQFGGSDYVLTLPCVRSTMQTYLGDWYTVFDSIIAAILFYYFVSNLILKINDTLNGADTMPYFYSSGKRTTRPSLADITHEHGHRT